MDHKFTMGARWKKNYLGPEVRELHPLDFPPGKKKAAITSHLQGCVVGVCMLFFSSTWRAVSGRGQECDRSCWRELVAAREELGGMGCRFAMDERGGLWKGDE